MWRPVEPAGGCADGPCARAKHSATLVGGHVYVLGGRGAGGSVPLRDFWRYSICSGEWERLTSRGAAPPSLQEHSATAHGRCLYVFGGEAGALSAETPLWIYDTESGYWRKLSGQVSGVRRRGRAPTPAAGGGPSGRRGHSAHALKDCLLIYGGYKDLRGSTNELWAFHYESESWQQVRTAAGAGGAGPARHRHAAALHDARLYVHAGQCDLRQASDLWTYDTISRVWSAVRAPGGKAGPGARAGHAAVRAGQHLYIFGGDADGSAANDMWRFHFATEMWERIVFTVQWPAARVDACALLVAGAVAGAGAVTRGAVPAVVGGGGGGTLLARLSSLRVRRVARGGGRCAYSALGERDSTESLSARDSPLINKSRSAHHITLARRQPADGADTEQGKGGEDVLTRNPISVPDFADVAVTASKLVYLDSDEEGETRTRDPLTTDEELSTSDYASAERVNRACVGFSNPHYLGPDVRALAGRRVARPALTPDSGVQAGDIELQDMRAPAPAPAPAPRLQLLLVGGREAPHVARLQGPLSMWAYSLH